jgi:hypothetical protein
LILTKGPELHPTWRSQTTAFLYSTEGRRVVWAFFAQHRYRIFWAKWKSTAERHVSSSSGRDYSLCIKRSCHVAIAWRGRMCFPDVY